MNDQKFYKVLLKGKSCHGGSGNHTWNIPAEGSPGDWHEWAGQSCDTGFRLTKEPARWWIHGAECFETEFEGVVLDADSDGNDVTVARVRLIRKLGEGDLENQNIFSCGTHVVKEGFVSAFGGASVRASGNARVRAFDKASVRASANARGRAFDNVSVHAFGNARVRAFDNVRVRASGNARVRASGYAIVRAFSNVSVRAFENAKVSASGNAKVSAEGASRVTAIENATVWASGNAKVWVDRDF